MKEEYKQIFLKTGKENEELIGKTIKAVSFLSNDIHSKHLIITFTDNTFIYIEADHSYNESLNEFELKNGYVLSIKNMNINQRPGYILSDGTFRYYEFVEEQIRLGIIEDDMESSKKIMDEIKKMSEEMEYKRYLELKKKYER